MDSLFAMTWRCQTRASTCSAPLPLMAALLGPGGSSTASWRTGPSPVFQHQLHSGHSRLPLNLSTQWHSEMLDESAQAPASPWPCIRSRLPSRAAKEQGEAPPRTCLLLLAPGRRNSSLVRRQGRRQGSPPPEREPVLSVMLQMR